MKKAVSVVVENFNTMRTGRANPAILDKIMVGPRGGGRGGEGGRGVAGTSGRFGGAGVPVVWAAEGVVRLCTRARGSVR